MPTLLQINTTCNTGSHGRLAELIGAAAIAHGYRSVIAYGRGEGDSVSETVRISSIADRYLHALETRLLDRHGLGSRYATHSFIKTIERFAPDIIQLHNIHGYYLNYLMLFNALKRLGRPVVWTMHDCWPLTGHCAHFASSGCDKWQTECQVCPQLHTYPASFLTDRSNRNFRDKRRAFSLPDRLRIVAVCQWQAELVQRSHLSQRPLNVIHNGIDTQLYKPYDASRHDSARYVVLCVANIWNHWKGYDDIERIRALLSRDYEIRVVGLTPKQGATSSSGITNLGCISDPAELARIYSAADVFVNLSYDDTYPTTLLESLSCGTPVVTYDAGGCGEAFDSRTGIVVPRGNVSLAAEGIKEICRALSGRFSKDQCRSYALTHHSIEDCVKSYMQLYSDMLQ